jgi:hypothetical protein
MQAPEALAVMGRASSCMVSAQVIRGSLCTKCGAGIDRCISRAARHRPQALRGFIYVGVILNGSRFIARSKSLSILRSAEQEIGELLQGMRRSSRSRGRAGDLGA